MTKKIIIIASSIIALVVSISLILVVTNDKKVKTYNVSFETNGGTEINTQVLNEGEFVVKPKDPKKEGYVFIQWMYGGKTYDFSSEVNSDLVLTAQWIETVENIETFIVNFNSDGGTTIPNQIIEKGNKVTVPLIPIKEGYTFIEWQYKGVKYDFDLGVNFDLELKAVYEKNKLETAPSNNSNSKPNTQTTTKPNSQPSDNITVITLLKPELKEYGKGGGPESFSILYDVTNIETVDGIELHKSTTGSNYEIDKTITKTQLGQLNNRIEITAFLGEHNYYKVRAYKTVNGKKVYSEYSNVIELKGPTN